VPWPNLSQHIWHGNEVPITFSRTPNRRYHKEKSNCVQNLKLFSLISYIFVLLYFWFT
jgi:hypothetical protein